MHNARKMGEYLGPVQELDDIIGLMGVDGHFLRVKVEVDTTKPLLAG